MQFPKFQKTGLALAVLMVAGLVTIGSISAQESKSENEKDEKKVKFKDLPAAVQATIKEHQKNGKIRGLSTEQKNGQTVYELELKTDGHEKDLLIDAAGNILEVEESVALDSLPAAAKAELVKQAGKGQIRTIESVTKNNVVVAYEAEIKAGGKTWEVSVTPDGQVVKQ